MSGNPSFVLKGILDVEIQQKPVPEIDANEVLVEVKKTGSFMATRNLRHRRMPLSIFLYQDNKSSSPGAFSFPCRVGDFIVEKPMVLGWESAGVVSKVGPSVTNVKVGDRVAMEPAASAKLARRVATRRICPDIVCAATPPTDGTLARYYRLPSNLAYPLPPNLSHEDGAMVHGTSFRGSPCCLVTRFRRLPRYCLDVIPDRLEFAKAYAATDTFLPPSMDKGESEVAFSMRNAQAMKKKLGIAEHGPRAVDLVLDASGADVAIQTGTLIAKSGGTFVQVGIGNPNITIDIFAVLCKGSAMTYLARMAQQIAALVVLTTFNFVYSHPTTVSSVTDDLTLICINLTPFVLLGVSSRSHRNMNLNKPDCNHYTCAH
ncbi:hypothetical protein CY34DRAFT_19106 [Suillus luteus UH-Slu-Lm8-n1]|uniref:Unplaced genomic scaffold CY34scaffold_1144, whole genome shotgun sequence n=1 Tax=Suillus luteus UH-Slu-Lm8-n1 TaxID=930992 RepID=A0A0C9Z4K2_9AGAM|nr:hypothetical protein CY34DRAFT_19106 [Suillus luteus UH-Slu-Lm8-n1]